MSGDWDGVTVPGYSLTGELGRGGMGVVYAAVQDGTGREVAIKVIRPGPGERVRRQFRREARAAQALRHPAIVPVHEHGESDGLLYLVMDRIPGRNLQELLDRDGPLPPAAAVELVGQVADAASALHRAGVVHCDIKPANVLVHDDPTATTGDSSTDDRPDSGDPADHRPSTGDRPDSGDPAADHRPGTGHQPGTTRPGTGAPGAGAGRERGAGPRVLLTDFGVAEPPLDSGTVGGLTADPEWLRSAGSAPAGQLSGPGGTYAFMAPEQWRGEPVDARTDVYGLGALLYATLTGAPPHAAATLPELVYAVIMTDPPRTAARDRAVPAALDEVATTAMARDPADRFGSAGEFTAALHAAAAGRRPARRRSRRRRVARRYQLIAAVAVLVLATAGTLAWWSGRHTGETRVVCAADITLRPEPGSSTKTATLHHGDHVRVTASARSGRWVLVSTPDGRRGWAVTQFLSHSGCGP